MLRKLWRKIHANFGFMLSALGSYFLWYADLRPYAVDIYRNYLRSYYPEMTAKAVGESVGSVDKFPYYSFILRLLAILLFLPRIVGILKKTGSLLSKIYHFLYDPKPASISPSPSPSKPKAKQESPSSTTQLTSDSSTPALSGGKERRSQTTEAKTATQQSTLPTRAPHSLR